jgi:hypothetical protein
VVQHPPANPVPRLDDENAGSRPLQLPGRGQADQAGAHHHDIGFGATAMPSVSTSHMIRRLGDAGSADIHWQPRAAW